MTGRFDRGAAPLRRPPGSFEDGFTILELVVVVAIIGLVMSIAAPSFNAARTAAQEHAAQANIRTALVAANTAYVTTPDQSFSLVTPAVLAAAEPSLRWSPTTSTDGPGTITTLNEPYVDIGYAVELADDAGDGTCFYAFQSDNAQPFYGHGPMVGGACKAHDASTWAQWTTPDG